MPKDEWQYGRLKDAKRRAEAEASRKRAGAASRKPHAPRVVADWRSGPLGVGIAPLVMPFGKHAGTPVSDLPENYVIWLETFAGCTGLLRRAVLARIASEHLAPRPRRCRPEVTPASP